jgi:hypothetical protein
LQDQIHRKSCILGKEEIFGDFSVGMDIASTGALMPENYRKNPSDYRAFFGKPGNTYIRGRKGEPESAFLYRYSP